MSGIDPGHGLFPSLRDVAQGAPQLEDELLAERLESAGEAWLRRGGAPSLADMLGSIPILRSRPISLDAAIDIVLRGLLAQGLSVEDASASLRRDAAGLEDAIEAHLAMRSMLGSMPAPGFAPETADDLPRPFGAALKDGRHRYHLEELVGSGAEGSVYRAMDRLLSADGRPLSVAIKMLHGWRDGRERRVSDEAARATRIRHPGIAALLDCGTCEGHAYLAYDFIHGLPLDRWRARRPQVSPREAAEIVGQLAEAVQVAHNAGVVHRDLKPTNVLADAGGAVHITDFGLAAALGRGPGTEAVGSLGFAAPEQLRADPGAEDASVDVYALGGLLYWLLTDSFPNGRSPEEVHRRLRQGEAAEAPDPRGRRPELDPTLCAICRRALAPAARARYPSAAVLAIDLSRWLAREPVPPFDMHPARRLRLWTRRSPVAAACTAAGVTIVIAALMLAWRVDLARRSASQRAELALVRERQESQQARMTIAADMVGTIVGAMDRSKNDAANFSWLPVLSAIEALSGEDALGFTELQEDVEEIRIQVARNALTAADAAGTRSSIEMTLWETTLGYWLLKVGRPQEAREVLEENRRRAHAVFPSGDPWTRDVEALCDVALILTTESAAEDAAARQRLRLAAYSLPPNIRKVVLDTIDRPQSMPIRYSE